MKLNKLLKIFEAGKLRESILKSLEESGISSVEILVDDHKVNELAKKTYKKMPLFPMRLAIKATIGKKGFIKLIFQIRDKMLEAGSMDLSWLTADTLKSWLKDKFQQDRYPEDSSATVEYQKLSEDKNVDASEKMDVEQLFALGREKQSNENYDEAILAYLKIINIEPEHIDSHWYLGQCYNCLQKYGDALEHLEKAVRLDPEAGMIYYDLGFSQFRTDQTDEAIFSFEKAINAGCHDPGIFYYLGGAYVKTGNVSLGRNYFYKAIKSDPKMREILTSADRESLRRTSLKLVNESIEPMKYYKCPHCQSSSSGAHWRASLSFGLPDVFNCLSDKCHKIVIVEDLLDYNP